MKLKIFLPIAAVVLLLVGVVIIAVELSTPTEEYFKDITLTGKDTQVEKLEVTIDKLVPGGSKEYTINLKGKSATDYNLSLEFSGGASNVLTDYITVTVEYGGEKYPAQPQTLSKLLAGEKISFKGKSASEIKIIYSMSEQAGNNTQNTTADFTITFVASK